MTFHNFSQLLFTTPVYSPVEQPPAKIKVDVLVSERKYKELFDTISDVILAVDIQCHITIANASCKEFFGMEPMELIGRKISEFYAYPEQTRGLLKQLDQKGVVRDYILQFKSKDGSIKTGSVHAKYIYDEANSLIGVNGTISNITDKVRAEDEIARIKDFYETILNSLSADIAVLDGENRYCYLNINAVKDENLRKWIIGKTDKEYCIKVGKDLSIAETRAQMHKVANETKETVEWIEELTDKNERKRNIVRILKPFTSITGEQYKVGYGLDVTQLKATEANLREKESYLRSLLESLPDMIFRLNKDGKFIDFKANKYEELAMKPEEFLGKTMHEIWPAEIADYQMQFINQALQSGKMVTHEYQMSNLAGEIGYFEARINKMSDEEVVIVVRNITERKEFEEKILNAVVQSEENERNRIAGELHDGVCQELTAAKLTIEMAEAMAGQENETLANMLNKCKQIVLNALNSVRRASHELMPKQLSMIGFCGMIESLVFELNQIDSIRYSLEIKGDRKEPTPFISINLLRIVQEFIRNSQKYADTEAIAIAIAFNEQFLKISIKDFGRGFDIRKITEKSGIGIFNMLKRIEAIGGRHILDSKPNQGVSLIIQVPIK